MGTQYTNRIRVSGLEAGKQQREGEQLRDLGESRAEENSMSARKGLKEDQVLVIIEGAIQVCRSSPHALCLTYPGEFLKDRTRFCREEQK